MKEQAVAVEGHLRPVIGQVVDGRNRMEVVDGVIELDVCLSGADRYQKNIRKIVDGLSNPRLALRTIGGEGLGVVLYDGSSYIGFIGLIPKQISGFFIQWFSQLEVSVEECHVGKKSMLLEKCWDYIDFVDDMTDEEYKKLMFILNTCFYAIQFRFKISKKELGPFSPRLISFLK